VYSCYFMCYRISVNKDVCIIAQLLQDHRTMPFQLVAASQGQINHCAGCIMGGGPRRQGPRSTTKFLPRCFFYIWSFECPAFSVGLNVQRRLKKVINFLGKEKYPQRTEKKVHA